MTAFYIPEEQRASGVWALLDVRLNNVSQLAGFAKRDDLRFLRSTFAASDMNTTCSWHPPSQSCRVLARQLA
jgi:hypothetical protein